MDTFSISALSQSTLQALPLLILLGTGLILMLLDAFFKMQKRLTWTAVIGLGLSAAVAFMDSSQSQTTSFFGMIATGGLASMIHVFLCLSGMFTFSFLRTYLKTQNRPITDAYALVVFAVLGMSLMANARDLLMTFIGLETMSMCLYIFAALYKRDPRSNEAGLKYFLLGSFASAFLLFGIALIYGVSGYYSHTDPNGVAIFVDGTTNFQQLAVNLANLQNVESLPVAEIGLQASDRFTLMTIGFGLMLVGFLFKLAAFPFHNWAPDVYTGTPTPLAGFMATGSKLAAFVALGTLLIELDVLSNQKMVIILAISAILSIIYGNVVAAQQSNIKRMLAYSSVAHSGYVLLGLCAVGQDPQFFSAVIFYMVIYMFMNIGAFGMVSMAERDFPDNELSHWKGLGSASPYFAGAFSIFLLSLAGIPPLAGFMGKYLVFLSAIRADLMVLAVFGILASVIGAYYYLRVIVTMFSGNDEKPDLNLKFDLVPTIGVVILVALIIILGLFPSLLLNTLDMSSFG